MPDLIAVVASLESLFLHHLESQRHAEVDLRQAQPNLHLLARDQRRASSVGQLLLSGVLARINPSLKGDDWLVKNFRKARELIAAGRSRTEHYLALC